MHFSAVMPSLCKNISIPHLFKYNPQMTDKKTTLLKLNKNLNIRKEREAKFASQAPRE